MSLTSFILKFAAPIPQVESFDRYLFVGPHPDDIEIGAGATIAKLVEAKKKVAFLICLDGRYGDGNSQSGELESIKTYLKLRSVNYGLRKGGLHGEGFRVLGALHMHCLPEAGL